MKRKTLKKARLQNLQQINKINANHVLYNKIAMSFVVDLRKQEQFPLADRWSYRPLTLPTVRTVQVKQFLFFSFFFFFKKKLIMYCNNADKTHGKNKPYNTIILH